MEVDRVYKYPDGFELQKDMMVKVTANKEEVTGRIADVDACKLVLDISDKYHANEVHFNHEVVHKIEVVV